LFFIPEHLAVDDTGAVYVVDSHNHSVRKIFADMVTTIGRDFRYPIGVSVDGDRNVYVADTYHHVIRKITPNGETQIVAGAFDSSGSVDGPRSDGRFHYPSGVALDKAGTIFVADGNYTVRKITSSGEVTTVAGAAGVSGFADGTGSAARFGRLAGVAIDHSGNLYVTDPTYHTLRKITPNGTVTTVAGKPGVAGYVDGIGSDARFYFPTGVAVDAAGAVYVADTVNDRVRVVMPLAVPVIETHPTSQTIGTGSTAVFTATASGAPLPTYQWEKNGEPIAGATHSTLVITAATEADGGAYACVVANSNGWVTSRAAVLTVASTSNPGRLMNLSVRANASADGLPLIVGFVVGGAGTRGSGNVLIRAAGPALITFGVPNVLADPRLTVFQGSAAIASNDNWATPAGNRLALQAAETVTGAFPFSDLSGLDAALLTELPPRSGGYTAWVNGTSSGTTLAELYDRTTVYSATTPRLINVSTRARVGKSPDVLIAGFVIGGETSKTVLIRAIGPGLEQFGITTALPDPQMALHTTRNGEDVIIATNAGWGGLSEISAIGGAVGAFPMTSTRSADAAMVRSLSPGVYTIHVTAVSGGAGEVLVEIYEVP
jgi:sugar lactone lactonase YvrE